MIFLICALLLSPPSLAETKDKRIVIELKTAKVQIAEVSHENGEIVSYSVGVLPYSPRLNRFVLIHAPGDMTIETLELAYEIMGSL